MSSSWQVVDDLSPSLLYTPQSSWRLTANQEGTGVNDGTIHTTSANNGAVTIRFSGTAIIVYTFLTPNSANFTAELDSSSTFIQSDPKGINITTPSITWGDLEDKEHTLVLRKSPNHPDWRSVLDGDTKSYLSLDYFHIKGTLLSPPDEPPSSGSSEDPSITRRGLTAPIAIGVILGVLALLLLSGALAWFWTRQKRIRRLQIQPYVHESTHSKNSKNDRSIHGDINEMEVQNPRIPSLNLPPSHPLGLPPPPTLHTVEEGREIMSGRGEKFSPNVASHRHPQSGSKRTSTLLELPGNRFIRVGSTTTRRYPNYHLPNIIERNYGSGYSSPSSPLGPSGPSSPSSPSYAPLLSSLAMTRESRSNEPGSPDNSTLFRDLGDPNDEYEPPSSPVGSSVIFPASTIASSVALPSNQW